MQGAPPLASLGLNPSGAGSRGEPLARRGSAPGWSPARPASVVPGGGGACPLCRLLPPAFSLLSCPLSPRPPSPAGKGVTKSLFRRGLRPRQHCTESLAALARPANPAPAGDSFSASPVRCKTDRTAFLLAVPAAKERGDRGRGTSAFEMVLSPGAGITSAARVQPRGFRGLCLPKNPAKPLTKHGFCDILSPELHRESGVLG